MPSTEDESSEREETSAISDVEGGGTTPPPRDLVQTLAPWCTAPHGSGCTRCVTVCPVGAISVNDEGPHIDPALCTRCGLCMGICDAFGWERSTLEDLVERACREADEEGFVCITCNECIFPGLTPRSNVVILPCLAAVPPEFWSALFARGIHVGIFHDPTYCANCLVADPLADTLFVHALESAEAWTGGKAEKLDTIPEREGLLGFYAGLDEDDRRGIISKIAGEGRDIATGKHRRRNAGTVSDFHEQQERMRAMGRIRSACGPQLTQVTWPRQELIVQAARALPGRAALLSRWVANTDKETCCHTNACIEVCPTGARRQESDGDISVDPTRCIACGACVAACTCNACDFRPITGLDYL